jgi:hypothetical protein
VGGVADGNAFHVQRGLSSPDLELPGWEMLFGRADEMIEYPTDCWC